MAKEFAKSFYNSKAWKSARAAYIAHRRTIDGGLCEICEDNVGYIVHHIKEITPSNISDTSVTLSMDNLMFVCKECHDRFDGHWADAKRRKTLCTFDERGQPIPPINRAWGAR